MNGRTDYPKLKQLSPFEGALIYNGTLFMLEASILKTLFK